MADEPLALEPALLVQGGVAERAGAHGGQRLEQRPVGGVERLGLGPAGHHQPPRVVLAGERRAELVLGRRRCLGEQRHRRAQQIARGSRSGPAPRRERPSTRGPRAWRRAGRSAGCGHGGLGSGRRAPGGGWRTGTGARRPGPRGSRRWRGRPSARGRRTSPSRSRRISIPSTDGVANACAAGRRRRSATRNGAVHDEEHRRAERGRRRRTRATGDGLAGRIDLHRRDRQADGERDLPEVEHGLDQSRRRRTTWATTVGQREGEDVSRPGAGAAP